MNKLNQLKKIEERLDSLEEDIAVLRIRTSLTLSALINLLSLNNPNGMNDYLIQKIRGNI